MYMYNNIYTSALLMYRLYQGLQVIIYMYNLSMQESKSCSSWYCWHASAHNVNTLHVLLVYHHKGWFTIWCKTDALCRVTSCQPQFWWSVPGYSIQYFSFTGGLLPLTRGPNAKWCKDIIFLCCCFADTEWHNRDTGSCVILWTELQVLCLETSRIPISID